MFIVFVQARSSNFDDKHNICYTLDKTLPKLKSFEDVLEIIEKSRYDEDEKAIYSAVKMKDENGKDIDVEVKFKVEDIQSVLDLKDKDNDPIQVSERLCKGL
ncbi:hypothetical protein Hanom_Chr05g00411861 [Helianthus anomalus]